MITKIQIPVQFVNDLIVRRSYSHYSFNEEVEDWFTENGFRYNCYIDYLLETIAQYFLEAPEEVLVAFKLRWL
jgi:hypothetical protein